MDADLGVFLVVFWRFWREEEGRLFVSDEDDVAAVQLSLAFPGENDESSGVARGNPGASQSVEV